MCNCRSDIESKLLENYKAITPGATLHQIKLTGYGFFLSGNHLIEQGKMGIEGEAVHRLKNGNSKPKKIKQDMAFTYCPFCAQPYDAEADKG